MSLTLEQQLSVQAAARTYVGAPWLGQGRTRQGIDCTGVIECAYHDGGMPVDIIPGTYQGIDSLYLMQRIRQFCDRIGRNDAAEIGDVVIYGLPQEAHCAILVDGRGFNGHPRPGLNMIHSRMYKKVAETRFDLERGLIRGIYRWRSLQSAL